MIEQKQSRINRIGFVHIPKSGGTSFTAALRASFSDVYGPRFWDYQCFTNLLADIDRVAGHIPYWLYACELRPRRLFTILRHPVERAISHYRYIHMISGHYAHKYVKENNISLGECFNHPLLRMEMSELQTRMLGWIPDRLPKLPCIEEDDNIDFAVTSSRYVFSSVDETDLERAVEHLRTQIDYGILEYPETVVALISRATGSDDIALPLLNVGNVEYQPSEAELDAIRRNNVLDLALYDAAVAMLAPGGQDAVASDPDTPSRPYVPSDEALAPGASNFIPVSAVAEPTHHPLQCHRLGASARDVGANEPALD